MFRPPTPLVDLFPSLSERPAARSVVVVRDGIDRAHRCLPLLLLDHVRRKSRNSGDEQKRVGYLGGQAEVAADGGDGAVDVDGKRMIGQRRMARERMLERA